MAASLSSSWHPRRFTPRSRGETAPDYTSSVFSATVLRLVGGEVKERSQCLPVHIEPVDRKRVRRFGPVRSTPVRLRGLVQKSQTRPGCVIGSTIGFGAAALRPEVVSRGSKRSRKAYGWFSLTLRCIGNPLPGKGAGRDTRIQVVDLSQIIDCRPRDRSAVRPGLWRCS
jgi:hypothetical protein